MTLQACNLISTTCCTNPVHAAVIRIACAAATAQSEQQNKVEYMHACSRVLMRSDTYHGACTWLCWQHSMLHKPCAARKTQNQEMAASRCNCTARVAQRSGIDVCLFRWLDPSNRCCRLYLAVMACCTNLCIRQYSEQPADSGC
jgi:hypothetical protein